MYWKALGKQSWANRASTGDAEDGGREYAPSGRGSHPTLKGLMKEPVGFLKNPAQMIVQRDCE